jgi:predicted ATPase
VVEPRLVVEHRLHFLTDGAPELPVHRQTLRNTIAWSHDPLALSEQALLRRIAVFVGGCTLPSAARAGL